MERWLTLTSPKFWISDWVWTWKDDWPLISPNNINLKNWPGQEKMTDPHTLTEILSFRFCLDMEKWLTPTHTENFKFWIQPGHAKMTDPTTLTKNFEFQIWPGTPIFTETFKFQVWLGHEKMTDPHPHWKFEILDSVWTWKDDWLPTSPNNLNFRLGLDMERWSTPTINFQLQIWPGHGKMTGPPPSPKILNFRFGLGMVIWPTLQPLMKFSISDCVWTW